MRSPLATAALVLWISVSVSAQEWVDFVSKDDRFTCNFPGQPTITQTTYKSQFGADLPARVYSAAQGPSRYSLTVVDYSPIEKILGEKAKSCPPGDERCNGGVGTSGPGYWRADYIGALLYATSRFLERDAKVTQLVWNSTGGVGGHQLYLTNRDGSRTLAAIYMHERKLYIMEATVPEGDPEPVLFQTSLGLIDENGDAVRYQSLYYHPFPPPPRVRAEP
jgi:hypothetical protein